MHGRGVHARRRSAERGTALLEYAVVLPLLLVLIFGVIDFGIYFFHQHTLQFATREGVRLAMVGRVLNDPAGNPLTREASIVQTIKDKAAVAVRPGDLQISIYPVNPVDYADPPGWPGRRDAGLPGQYMRVKTRSYYTFINPLFRALLPDGRLMVQAEATYRNELFD